jgi:hypothetical protein
LKKIGIVTIWNYNNYGNRLQNYATQEVLKSLGFEVETIVNDFSTDQRKQLIKKNYFNKFKSMTLKDFFYKVITKFQNIKNFNHNQNKSFLNINKENSFKKFTDQYINKTSFVIPRGKIPSDLDNNYYKFITGSDQVWNPFFKSVFPPVHFLSFAPKNKRIAFSASFGVSNIPKEFLDDYKLWIAEMEHLSVREQEGAEIVKELTDRTAVVLVDPTLLLTKQKWISISKPSIKKPKQKYILTYFLGGIAKEDYKKIRIIAESNKLTILQISSFEDKERYATDPSEFIDYINSASLILTDSFHGAVFSILFEKPFIVFQRLGALPSMYSRIDTLLSKFKLEARKWENIKNNNELFNVDYSHIPSILEMERKKALDYLKNALDVKDAN